MLVGGGTQKSQKFAERRAMGCPSERNCQKLSRNYFKKNVFVFFVLFVFFRDKKDSSFFDFHFVVRSLNRNFARSFCVEFVQEIYQNEQIFKIK